MLPPTLRSTCTSYLMRSHRRVPAPYFARPWIHSRNYARVVERSKPSRMVLSSSRAVARGGKVNRNLAESPWGGMNQTVARIPDKESRGSASRTRAGTTEDGAGKKDWKPSRNFGRLRRDDSRKAMKMQRALATVSYGQRMTMKEKLKKYESFDQFNLLPALKQALLGDTLKGLEGVVPTPIQRLALASMLPDTRSSSRPSKREREPPKEFLLAAETGSGKTLAYLLPAINAMKTAEAQDTEVQDYMKRRKEELDRQRELEQYDPPMKKKKNRPDLDFDEPHPAMARPKVVVLVPTAELVEQVGAVAKSLAHVVKFRSEKLSANLSPQIIRRNVYSPRGVDVMISTPSLFESIVESDPHILARVSHLIVDEADSLLDRSFAPTTTNIIARAKPVLQQLVFCSATIPRKLDTYLSSEHPDMMRITTPNLHAVPRRVVLGVVDVSRVPYHNNKLLACADTIYNIGRDAARHEGPVEGHVDVCRIMVFVNERDTCQEVADYLYGKGISAIALNRDTDEQRRSDMLDSFRSKDPLRIEVPPLPAGQPRGARTLPNVKVIVATDLASRGIDTIAVRHVVLYDVPHSTIDFIHRLGRAGRMNRRGRAVVLVGNADRKDVVAEVKESMFMGKALI